MTPEDAMLNNDTLNTAVAFKILDEASAPLSVDELADKMVVMIDRLRQVAKAGVSAKDPVFMDIYRRMNDIAREKVIKEAARKAIEGEF
ncbi:MAG: hypothetical protein AB7U76_24365 [Pirellulales bacterium]